MLHFKRSMITHNLELAGPKLTVLEILSMHRTEKGAGMQISDLMSGENS